MFFQKMGWIVWRLTATAICISRCHHRLVFIFIHLRVRKKHLFTHRYRRPTSSLAGVKINNKLSTNCQLNFNIIVNHMVYHLLHCRNNIFCFYLDLLIIILKNTKDLISKTLSYHLDIFEIQNNFTELFQSS